MEKSFEMVPLLNREQTSITTDHFNQAIGKILEKEVEVLTSGLDDRLNEIAETVTKYTRTIFDLFSSLKECARPQREALYLFGATQILFAPLLYLLGKWYFAPYNAKYECFEIVNYEGREPIYRYDFTCPSTNQTSPCHRTEEFRSLALQKQHFIFFTTYMVNASVFLCEGPQRIFTNATVPSLFLIAAAITALMIGPAILLIVIRKVLTATLQFWHKAKIASQKAKLEEVIQKRSYTLLTVVDLGLSQRGRAEIFAICNADQVLSLKAKVGDRTFQTFAEGAIDQKLLEDLIVRDPTLEGSKFLLSNGPSVD